jgi:hypothetical protein
MWSVASSIWLYDQLLVQQSARSAYRFVFPRVNQSIEIRSTTQSIECGPGRSSSSANTNSSQFALLSSLFFSVPSCASLYSKSLLQLPDDQMPPRQAAPHTAGLVWLRVPKVTRMIDSSAICLCLGSRSHCFCWCVTSLQEDLHGELIRTNSCLCKEFEMNGMLRFTKKKRWVNYVMSWVQTNQITNCFGFKKIKIPIK